MNVFFVQEIERILDYPENLDDAEIAKEVFDVIYSLGRDACNSDEYMYSYELLLGLCKRKSMHVKAYAILALSLMSHSGVLRKEDILPIIKEAWRESDDWSRGHIVNAVDDLNSVLGWNIVVNNET